MMALKNITRDVKAEEEGLMAFLVIFHVDGAHFSRDNGNRGAVEWIALDPWVADGQKTVHNFSTWFFVKTTYNVRELNFF